MQNVVQYDMGTTVGCSATFTATDLVTLVDPTTLTAKVVKPDGTVVDYTPDIVHVSLGRFYIGVTTDQPGRWGYAFLAGGNVLPIREESGFDVPIPRVPL